MTKPDQQQLGISNDIKERIRKHKSFGWSEMDCTGPHDGKEVLEIEKVFKKWLRNEIGLVPHKQENWFKAKMEVHSLAE